MVSTQPDPNQQNQLIQERGQGLHLYVKETFLSLTHDDFVVINEITGEKLFTVTRKLTSVRKQRKTLYDASGNVLWTVEHPTFRLFHRRYRFYNDKGRKIFIIRSHHRLMPSQGRKLTMSTDDGNEIISKGSTFDAKTAIDLVTREGSRKQWKPLARVMNPVVSTRGLITGLSGYKVLVAPDANVPLCLGFVLVLDEERELHHGGLLQVFNTVNRVTKFLV